MFWLVPFMTAAHAGDADDALQRDVMTIEQEVTAAKASALHHKAALQALDAVALEARRLSPWARIEHVNELGSRYVFTRARYAVDGVVFDERRDAWGTEPAGVVYEGPLPSGKHELHVDLEIRDKRERVSLHGYSYKLRCVLPFTTTHGEVAEVTLTTHQAERDAEGPPGVCQTTWTSVEQEPAVAERPDPGRARLGLR